MNRLGGRSLVPLGATYPSDMVGVWMAYPMWAPALHQSAITSKLSGKITHRMLAWVMNSTPVEDAVMGGLMGIKDSLPTAGQEGSISN